MSDVWDSAVDDYLSGFGRPTPPGSPERMAKSMQLGSQTGVAPSIISLDPETWQSRLLDAKNAELLRGSAPLQSYVAKNPDYKEVSKDDFENLNQVADQTKLLYKPLPDPGFGGTLETVAPQGAVPPEAQKNFGTSLLRIWNDAYKAMHAEEGLGIKPGGEFETQFREAFPPGLGRTLIESIMYPSAAALDLLFQRYPAAIIAGAGAGAAEAGGAAGLPQPELLGRDISAMLEWLTMRSDFLAEKPGNFETLARKDIAQLDAVIRSIERTNTKERAPQAMFDFVKPLAEDQTISVPGDVVSRLYEEKGIAPGSAEDTLFPFVPDISEQLARTEAAGGDVHIPASSFLTHVKPEVFDEILQDVRVLDRPTINEAKEIDEAAAEVMEEIRTIRKEAERKPVTEDVVAKPVEAEAAAPVDLTIHEVPLPEGSPPREIIGQADIPAVRYGNDVWVGQADHLQLLHAIGSERSIPIEKLDEAKLDFGTMVDGKFKSYGDTTANVSLDWQRRAAEFVNRVADEIGVPAIRPVEAPTAKEILEAPPVKPTPVAVEPPVPPDTVRFYHGGVTPTEGGRWITPDRAYAQGYAEKSGGQVFYVDVPKESATEVAARAWDEIDVGTNMEGRYRAIEASEEITKQLRPIETGIDTKRGFEAIQSTLPETEVVLAREVPPATLEGERVFRPAIPATVGELPGLKEAMRESISKGPATTPLAGQGLEGELTSARKALFLDTLFHDAKAAGMTEPELAAYSKRLEQVRDEEIERRRAAFERQERQRVRKATAAERRRGEEYYDNRRDVQAEQLLRSAGVKLDEKLVKPETVRKGLTSKDGVNPDDIAETMGYGSGEELLRDLEGLHAERAGQPPREAREFAISKFVEEAKIEPVRTDLTDAMFSEPMSKLLFDDLRVMSRQRGGTEFEDPLMFEELAARADRLYSEMPLSEAADFKSFARDVQKLGREAELALVKGDIEKAFKFKNQQLLAHMMAREARRFEREFARPLRASLREPRVRTPEEEAQAAVAAALAPEVSVPRRLSPSLLLERYQKKTPPKSVDSAYTDQIHAILTQHGIPIRRDIAELASVVQQDLRSFVAGENALGADIQISDRLYESRFNKNPRDMTVQEHRELFESLQSLDYNGRMKEKLRKQGELEDREAVVKQIEDNLAQLPVRDKGKKRDPARTLQGARYGWDAWLLRPEELMDDLDLRDPQGPMNSYVFRPLQDSKHMEEGLTREASARLRQLPKVKGAKKLVADVPFLNEATAGEGKQPYPYRLNKLDVVMMAAQLGNETSAERLIMTLFQRDFNDAMPAGARAALIKERRRFVQDWVESKLTPEDFKFVEGMWDFFAWLKPKVDEVALRTSGVRPDTVRATPWNNHKGGYFPIILDPAWSKRTPKEDVLFGPDYHAAATPKGYTKARTEMFNPVVVANQQYLLPGRIREMLHDISFRESLTQAWRIVNEPRVRSAINKHYGVEYTETLKPWLREIAYSFNQDDMSQKQLSQLLRGLRKNAVIATLGANLKVIMTPNAGPLLKYLAQSIVGHGGRTVPGLSQVRLSRMLLHPKHMWEFAMENSQEMKHRVENYDRDIRDSLGSMMNIQSKREWLHANAARAGMYIASRIDTALAAVAWNEEYARVYQTGKSYFSADEKVFDHDAAVYAADKLVRKFFGSHSPVDIPAAMRGSEIQKTFLTPFYGFQSAMYQRQRDVVQATRSGIRRWKKGDKTGARADFASALGQTWMFVLLSAALGAVYAPDLVDEEDWGGTAVKLLAGQLMSTIPFLRDVGQLALTETEGRPAPVMTGFVNMKKVVKDISDFLEGEGDFSQQRFVKHALATAGYVLGIPTVQPARTTEFLWNWTTGEDDAETFDEWFRGIVYGKSGKKE